MRIFPIVFLFYSKLIQFLCTTTTEYKREKMKKNRVSTYACYRSNENIHILELEHIRAKKVNIERINWNRICLFNCSASSKDGHRRCLWGKGVKTVQCACACKQLVHTVLAFISILLCNENAINILRENFALWILCASNLNEFCMNAIQFMFIPIVFSSFHPL